MVDARVAPPSWRRLAVYRTAAAAAAVYFVAGGMLSLWFPNEGLDLYVSYVAGACTARHESPYERAAYVKTWDSLDTPRSLADTRKFAFGYPPSWIPVCLALSRLPWPVARTVWMLLNVAFLVGSVLVTLRLLQDSALDACDRYAVWCFALALSPTLTVMTVGQTSLLVLFALLLAGVSLHRGRPLLAGLALAVAMIKPQLASAFVVFLVLRAAVAPLAVGAVCSMALTALGLFLARSDVATYVAAVGTYTVLNGPASHIAVGIASLLAHMTDLSTPAATAVGVAVGLLVLAGITRHRRTDGAPLPIPDVLPVVLYVAPLAFRCHAYDLVALIPLFAWSRAPRTAPRLRYAIQVLCLGLVLPRSALRIVYETTLGGVMSPASYEMVERGFRTWILLLLLPPVLLALQNRAGFPAVPLAHPTRS